MVKMHQTFITNSFILVLFIIFGSVQSYVGKLPYCTENFVPGLVLVSTIDGKFSAINSEGTLQWQIDTEPGPLLTSNIHNLELTNSGKWIRIIPSLTGSLYRFDGNTIDAIPISAESLLKSSFKYSDDLVIAGGLEVQTYGIGFRNGKIFYVCSSLSCTNNTNNENDVDDILLLERTTHTVRAVESQSGHERWNFSVGHHNIRVPQISCIDPKGNLFNWNITAIIPDGLLLASNYQDNVEITWQYHFTSPIVRVWKWDGHEISEINLFQIKSNKEPSRPQLLPSIYLGMHKKQLYIHESYSLRDKIRKNEAIAETGSVAKIPWKPVSASGLLTEDDSTAISVLYSSEYVNGHGYYLYSEFDMKPDNRFCGSNVTAKIPFKIPEIKNLGAFMWFWWKEILVALFIMLILNFSLRLFTSHQQKQKIIFVERHIEVPSHSNSSTERTSESSDSSFNSRYMNDFDTLRCLGKGGFGVVFEVKQKIDECHYAIKRIVLPNEESKRETVMREVKALAKLEHRNIVRYFNAWVEKPPCGWQQQYDKEWIKEASDFPTEKTTTYNKIDTFSFKIKNNDISDSFIVFNESCDKNSERNDYSKIKSNVTDVISHSDSQHSENYDVSTKSDDSSLCEVYTENPPVFLYIQMQLCQKHSLKEWLVENKNRQTEDILGIFRQIVSAVEYVHMQGLIHRDLKPSNIFFSMDGQIKVGDFGLVKDEVESNDIHSSLNPLKGHTKEVGTRLYMSPEQVNGQKYNYKVDIYSLGLIFFELLVYFSTDMERIKTLSDLRKNNYPKDFIEKHGDEYNLLTMMLCQLPEKRLTTFGIRARAPLNCRDTDYSKAYDFELPKPHRTIGQIN